MRYNREQEKGGKVRSLLPFLVGVPLLLLVLGGPAVSAPAVPADVFSIADFGALPDGRTVNTAAVRKAVDRCAEAGGGRVLIPTGTWVTGTIFLRSGVELHLEQGAVLLGSEDLADYEVDGQHYGLIYARGARNVSVTGTGTIDGRGGHFHLPDRLHIGADFDRRYTRQGEAYLDPTAGILDGPIAYEARPGMMLVFLECENVRLTGVTLRDSPSWTVRLGDCDTVLVHGVTIRNNLLIPNSDGIHITTSRRVRVSDCDVQAGDDAVIVTGFQLDTEVHGEVRDFASYAEKPGGNRTGYAEDIVVTNCVLQSRSSGIRVGYGPQPIRRLVFSHLIIKESNRGLGVFSRDGSPIEDVVFSDVIVDTRLHTGHWWGNGEPIHVSAVSRTPGVTAGPVRRIRFHDIEARGEAGIIVFAEEPGQIADLEFRDVRLRIGAGPHTLTYGGNFDLRPTAKLENGIFRHDIPGFYARGVQGLRVVRLALDWETGLPAFFTSGFEVEESRDVWIEEFVGRPAGGGAQGTALRLRDVAGATIRQCRALPGTGLFLSLSQVTDLRAVHGNDARDAVRFAEGSLPEEAMSANLLPRER
jgi:hypothetical protein